MLCFSSNGQSVSDISISLKTIAGSTLIAGNYSIYSKTDKYDKDNINYDSSLNIKGVPKNFKNYIIKILDFQPEQGVYELYLRYGGNMDANSLQQGLSIVSKDFAINDTLKLSQHPIKHFVLFIVGEDSKGKKFVIPDVNNNYDFSDDPKFLFDSLNKDNYGQIKVSYQYVYNGNIKDRFINLRASTVKHEFNYLDSADQKFYLIVYLDEYKSGNLLIKNSKYNFKIINAEVPFITFKKNINLYYNNENNNYEIGDTIYLKTEKYVITAYSYFGDSLYLRHTGFGKIIYGKYPGEYAYNIQQADIFDAPFNLNDYRGKYVLIDFWGSWCVPCIESIPDLVAFSKKYLTNLQIVSIAEDDPNNLDIIKNLINIKKMNWIHLFENMNKNSKRKIASSYNIQSYPTQIMIDPAGKIVFRNFNELRLTEKKLASIIGF